jgi:Spy/CpxP family protein refolding chaperone
MFKKLRNALFALTALLSFTALAATPNTASAASSAKYTPKYIKRQVVL